jgi:transposase-like protein
MPLTHALDHVVLTHPCPHCGRAVEKPGSWFKSAASFRCVGCGANNRITYEEKLSLFAASSGLASWG